MKTTQKCRYSVLVDVTETWPVVVRQEAVDAVSQTLAERPAMACVIEGDAGVGKTVLARAVLQGRSAQRTLVVQGQAERRSVPLAAFGELARSADLTGDPVKALVATVGAGPGRLLVLVDDAAHVDVASAEAVRRLVVGFGADLIVTARRGEELPSPLAALQQAGRARRILIEGLDVDAAGEVLSRRFRIPARREDVHRLVWQTAGNPLHLRVIVERAIDSGRVLHRGDAVEIVADASTRPLVTTVAARVAELPPRARGLLSLVSLTEPVAFEALTALGYSEEDLQSARSSGMVTVDDSGRLTIAHPLVTEVLDAHTDRAVVRDAVRVLRADDGSARRFAAIVLDHTHGGDVSAEDLVWASTYASAHGDGTMALSLAASACSAPAARAVAFAAHLAAGRESSVAGRNAEADQYFSVAHGLAQDAADRAALASHRGEHLAFRAGDPIGAVAQAEAVRPGLTAGIAIALDADIWRWRSLAGAPGDSGFDDTQRAVGEVVAATMRADTTAARIAAEPLKFVDIDDETLRGRVAIARGLRRYVELRAEDRCEDAARHLEAVRATGDADVGFATVLLAAQRSLAGQAAAADSLSAVAVEQLQRWDGGELLPLALAVRATVHAQRGRTAEATRGLAELGAQEVSGAAVLQREQARALLLAAEGKRSAAADLIIDVVTDAIRSGYRFLGALTLSDALRYGDVERAAALASTICAELVDPVAPCAAVRDTAVVLRDRDGEGLCAAAAALARAGLAPAAVDAITIGLRAEMPDALRRRLTSLASTFAADIDVPLMQPRVVETLTPREREIAKAAADRLRTREIAGLLGVSPRTVENHLHTVYRKLGVGSRDALREALAAQP